MNSLADDPAHETVRRRLAAALAAWMAECGDEGQGTAMAAPRNPMAREPAPFVPKK